EVLGIHDAKQLAGFSAVEMNLVTQPVTGCEVHRLEAHPARVLQHDRPDPEPALAGFDVDALREQRAAFALLLEAAFHGDDCVVHGNRLHHLFVLQKQRHRNHALTIVISAPIGYSAASLASAASSSTTIRPSRKPSSFSGSLNPELARPMRSWRIWFGLSRICGIRRSPPLKPCSHERYFHPGR